MRTWAAILIASSLASSTVPRAEESGNIRLPTYTNKFSKLDRDYTGHTVFRCAFSDVVTADNGKIKPGGIWATTFAEANDNFTFDAATGAFRSHGSVTMLNVVRQGDSQSDLVAHVPGADPLMTVMRLQAYAKPITFFMIDHTAALTGTCVKL